MVYRQLSLNWTTMVGGQYGRTGLSSQEQWEHQNRLKHLGKKIKRIKGAPARKGKNGRRKKKKKPTARFSRTKFPIPHIKSPTKLEPDCTEALSFGSRCDPTDNVDCVGRNVVFPATSNVAHEKRLVATYKVGREHG